MCTTKTVSTRAKHVTCPDLRQNLRLCPKYFIRSYAAAIPEANGDLTCRPDGCAADGVTCTDADGNPNDPCLPDGKLIEIEVFEQHECKVDNPTQKALKRVDLENDEFFMNCPNIEITSVNRPDSPVTPESIGFNGKGIQLNAERRDYILKVWINNFTHFEFCQNFLEICDLE